MTILILAEPFDATAYRLSAVARQSASTHDLRVLSPLEIVLAPQWLHRVGVGGVVTELCLRDGSRLRSQDIAGVFNRLCSVPSTAFGRFGRTDREYAQIEMHSLLVSWLASLRCPVINPASPHALSGSPLSTVRWQMLAHRAGLMTAALRMTTSQRRFPAPAMVQVGDLHIGAWREVAIAPAMRSTGPGTFREPIGGRAASIVVVGDSVWPEGVTADECERLADPCRRLARDSGMRLLRVYFVSNAGENAWLFSGADAVPDVTEVGPLMALVDALAGRSAVSDDQFATSAAR